MRVAVDFCPVDPARLWELSNSFLYRGTKLPNATQCAVDHTLSKEPPRTLDTMVTVVRGWSLNVQPSSTFPMSSGPHKPPRSLDTYIFSQIPLLLTGLIKPKGWSLNFSTRDKIAGPVTIHKLRKGKPRLYATGKGWARASYIWLRERFNCEARLRYTQVDRTKFIRLITINYNKMKSTKFT